MPKWIDKFFIGVVVKRIVEPIAKYMDGKKTLTGVVSLFIWALIYLIPTVYPQFLIVAQLGDALKSALEAAGVRLDTELLTGGITLTVVGVLHKIKKYLSKE